MPHRQYRQSRRAESTEETRRRIVEATYALHAEQGMAATSMKQIAARADVSVGTERDVDIDTTRLCGKLIDAGVRSARKVRDQYSDTHLVRAESAGPRLPIVPWDHPDWVLARAVAAAVVHPDDAKLIAATRLRKGSTNSIRGAAKLLADTLATVRRAGATGLVLVRADSAYYGYDIVAAAGGDGTVHAVINGLCGDGPGRAALAILPLGTANDLSRTLCIPLDPWQSFELLERPGFEPIDLARVKARLGIPPHLAACHTAEIGGYVIEGHVPASAIARLLSERPAAAGLAVPGMPIGSPGMEVAGSPDERYDVILFGRSGERTYARFHGRREL